MGIFGMNYNTIYFRDSYNTHKNLLETYSPVRIKKKKKTQRFRNNQIKKCYYLYIEKIYLKKKKKMHPGYWWRKIYGTITKKEKIDSYYTSLKYKLFTAIPFYEKYKDLNSLDY